MYNIYIYNVILHTEKINYKPYKPHETIQIYVSVSLWISVTPSLGSNVLKIWAQPYVNQKTSANQIDAFALFTLAESGWK